MGRISDMARFIRHHGIKKYDRKINGKYFKVNTATKTKKYANKLKKDFTDLGHKVRIIKSKKSGDYLIYLSGRGTRKKKK